MRIRPVHFVPAVALLLADPVAAAPPAATPPGPPTDTVRPDPSPQPDPAPPSSAPGSQVQAPSGSNTQVQGPGTQSQQSAPNPPAYPGGPPSIQVNPQIQVQVQPTIDSTANPKADAKSDADANAEAQANPDADAEAKVENEVSSDTKAAPSPGGGVVVTQRERAPESTPDPSGKKVIRVVVKHHSTPHVHHDYVDHHHRRGAGLLFGGVLSFGAGYTAAAVNGGYLYDRCDQAGDADRCRRLARDLFIPVAGPFMGMDDVRTRKSQVKLGIMGGAQSLGVLMTVVGAGVAIHDARERRILNEHGIRVADGVRIAPTASVEGAGLRLRAKF